MIDKRSAYLTCAQVAARHGVTRQSIARLCRLDAIYPIMKVGRTWLIAHDYVIAVSVGRRGQPGAVIVKSKHARRGRPKGSKNSRPYPKGVKRPRKKSLGLDDGALGGAVQEMDRSGETV